MSYSNVADIAFFCFQPIVNGTRVYILNQLVVKLFKTFLSKSPQIILTHAINHQKDYGLTKEGECLMIGFVIFGLK